MLAAASSRAILTTLSSASGPGLRASFMSQASAPTVASAPSSRKVSSPLTLDRPIRRGLRGGWVGGGTGSVCAALLPRPNKLTRGRGPSPSPESGSPLMLFAACSLSLVLQFKFRAEDGYARRRSPAELSRPAVPGEQGIAPSLLSSVCGR